MRETKVKNLLDIMDLEYYLSDKSKLDIHIDEWRFFDGLETSEDGWYEINNYNFIVGEYLNYTVDSVVIYDCGGFRLRITRPKTLKDKLQIMWWKLWKTY